jgi:hypothetical protein
LQPDRRIVCDLIGFSEQFAEPAPGLGIMSRRHGAGTGRRREQGASLRAVIVRQRNLVLALPGLPRYDASGPAGSLGQDADQAGGACAFRCGAPAERFKCCDDQRIADEQRERLSVGALHRRFSATHSGIVEAWKVVVSERCTMNELDRGRGGIGKRRLVIATC